MGFHESEDVERKRIAPDTSFQNISFHISNGLPDNGDADMYERSCAVTMKTKEYDSENKPRYYEVGCGRPAINFEIKLVRCGVSAKSALTNRTNSSISKSTKAPSSKR